jgi:hypothetical protein
MERAKPPKEGAQKSRYIIRESVHMERAKPLKGGCAEIEVYFKGECAHGESETAERRVHRNRGIL